MNQVYFDISRKCHQPILRMLIVDVFQKSSEDVNLSLTMKLASQN